ncbi:MAG: hypothetical protein E3J72_01300 [Planctomycetota bacterium]|nr:MAG: hypothetical protein E3J72_01300 [Planctomycetota bacterium]
MNQELPEQMSRDSGFRATLAVLLALACAVGLAYANSVKGDFVFDDMKIVRDNPAIRNFDIKNILGHAFDIEAVEKDPTKTDPGYRPVRMLSYALDAAIAGRDREGRPTPAVFHITNIIFHFLNTFLVYLILHRLFRGRFLAVVGALVFALHPLQTEAVTYISGRKDVLFAFFYLLGFLSFLRYRAGGARVWIVVILVTYLLSLFSKEMAITLPVVCFAYDVVTRISKPEKVPAVFGARTITLYTPIILAGVLFAVFALAVKNPAKVAADTPYLGGSFLASIATIGRVLCHYFRLIFLPVGLSVDYSFNAFPASKGAFSPWTTLPAVLIVLGIIGFAVASVRKRPLLAFGVFMFFIAMAPVSGLVPHPEPIAERFLYLPMIGIVLAVLAVLKKPVERFETRVIFGSIMALVLLAFLGLTVRRNAEWESPHKLYAAAVRVRPDCVRMRVGLAGEYRKRNNNVKAFEHYGKAVEIYENAPSPAPRDRGFYLRSLSSYAVTAIALEKYDVACRNLEKLLSMSDVLGEEIRTSPQYRIYHYNFGEALRGLGNGAEAEKAYGAAIDLYGKSGDKLDLFTHRAFSAAIILALRRQDIPLTESLWDRMVAAMENPLRVDHALDVTLVFLTRLVEAGENTWADRVKRQLEPYVRKSRSDPKLRRIVVSRLWKTAEVLRREKYRFRVAAALYEDMAALDRGDPRPLYPLGICYKQMGDLDRADEVMKRLKGFPDLEKSMLKKVYGELLDIAQRKADRARRALPSMDKARSYVEAARKRLKQLEPAEADNFLAEAIKVTDDLPFSPAVAAIAGEAYMLRAMIAEKSAKAKYAGKGVEALSRALESTNLSAEKAAELWAFSAELYGVLNKMENAATAWMRAVEYSPDEPAGYHKLGLAYLRLGEGGVVEGNAGKFNVLAFELLQNATHRFEDYMPSYYALAQASLRIRRYDIAVDSARTFIARSDNEELFAPALIMLARAWIGIPDLDQAAEALDNANAETVAVNEAQKAEIKRLRELIKKAKKEE